MKQKQRLRAVFVYMNEPEPCRRLQQARRGREREAIRGFF
jgi:hypothetical protein